MKSRIPWPQKFSVFTMKRKTTCGQDCWPFRYPRSIVFIIPGFTSVLSEVWDQGSSLLLRQRVQPDEGLVVGVKH